MHLSDQQSGFRQRFESNNIDTASPGRVLTMCFDRLDRDLALAAVAIRDGNAADAHGALTHAQDLLSELATMLDLERWEHAGSLLAIYDFLLRLLAQANLLKELRLVTEAQQLLSEIGDAFRTAAAAQPTMPPTPPAPPAPLGAAAGNRFTTTAPSPSHTRPPHPAESTLEPATTLSVRA